MSMDIHITIADLPDKVEAVGEAVDSTDVYIAVQRGLSQAVTACAVADVITTAVQALLPR
jgi:hypothetical protein